MLYKKSAVPVVVVSSPGAPPVVSFHRNMADNKGLTDEAVAAACKEGDPMTAVSDTKPREEVLLSTLNPDTSETLANAPVIIPWHCIGASH